MIGVFSDKTHYRISEPVAIGVIGYNKPFVLSFSKHEWRRNAPFDKLRVNGKKYVFSIMDS
jgi:hypothetical protein